MTDKACVDGVVKEDSLCLCLWTPEYRGKLRVCRGAQVGTSRAKQLQVLPAEAQIVFLGWSRLFTQYTSLVP